MSEMIERAARAVCGNSLSGFCANVGKFFGCKVGRGESFNGSNCVATRDQLLLTEHWTQACGAIQAIREPSDAQVLVYARKYFYDNWGDGSAAAARDYTTAEDAWRDMVDALLDEGAGK